MQGLAAMRDRLTMVVTGRVSKTSQLEDRLKVTTAQRHHDNLAPQMNEATIATQIILECQP